jgi:hypothetical protein
MAKGKIEKISETLTLTGETCDRGCCAVIECRPLGENSLPTVFEIPYEGLDKKIEENTVGTACSEILVVKASMPICRITGKVCPNLKSF